MLVTVIIGIAIGLIASIAANNFGPKLFGENNPKLDLVTAAIAGLVVFIAVVVIADSVFAENDSGVLAVRVATHEGDPVADANVLFVHSEGANRKTTDTDGLSTLLQPSAGRLVVTASGYEPVELNLDASAGPQDLKLDGRQPEQQTVLMRARGDDGRGIPGATVVLSVAGAKFEDVTDELGFVAFELGFGESSLDIEVVVRSGTAETSRLIALTPQVGVVDIVLSSAGEVTAIGADAGMAPSGPTTTVNGYEVVVRRMVRQGQVLLGEFSITSRLEERVCWSFRSAKLIDTSTNSDYPEVSDSQFPTSCEGIEPGATLEVWSHFEIGDQGVPAQVTVVLSNGIRIDNVSVG